MFPVPPSHRSLPKITDNSQSSSKNQNSGEGTKTAAPIIKVEPSPSPAPERISTRFSVPISTHDTIDDMSSLSDFSGDETVILSDDESDMMDTDSEDENMSPPENSLPVDSDSLSSSSPLLIFTTSLDDDAELDESSATSDTEAELSSSWEGEFGDDPALPFYDAPNSSELFGYSDDPTDGWIFGLDRSELEDRLRARRLVSSYSELQNPDVVRSHVRPLAHDLRNLLATLSHAKTPSLLHKDDEAFVNDFRNRLGDSVRMMQRGVPYVGSLYA